ncbi:hypothetical protein [Streptomyces sp. NPDC006510]|uniref:hypothetical protein n=1 Tax=Streptomyces sp. NPDC006510 TaxID=3155600 RepID=UPI0033B8C462
MPSRRPGRDCLHGAGGARAAAATRAEQHLLARSTPTRTPPPPHPEPEAQAQQLSTAPAGAGEDSLDDLDQDAQDVTEDETPAGPAAHVAGYGLYDARAEALKW